VIAMAVPTMHEQMHKRTRQEDEEWQEVQHMLAVLGEKEKRQADRPRNYQPKHIDRDSHCRTRQLPRIVR
jgi:hypothetical protein